MRYYRYTLDDLEKSAARKRFTYISFFAGGGGSSAGYKLAGGDCKFVNEFQQVAVDTYLANWPNTPHICGDIKNVTGQQIMEMTGIKKYELDIMVGFSFQETIAVSNLIFGGVLERHPKLKICISHGGGMLPFVAGRLSKASRKRSWVPMKLRADGAFEEEIRKLWYDSHVHSRHSLDLLEKIVGNDRIVYGTNFAGWDQPETYEVDERSEQWRLNTLELFNPNEK